MEKLFQSKKESFDGICTILKALALFFCFYPLFGVFFVYAPRDSLNKISLESLGISLALLLLVLVIWLILQPNKSTSIFRRWLEISVFYGICFVSILCSGAYHSDYKFLFIFMVVTYTLQYGTRYGMFITVISSATLLGIDFYFRASPQANHAFQSDIALSIMFGILSFILGQYVRLQSEHIDKLTHLASFDGLTQLYNHRYFHEAMEKRWQIMNEKQESTAIIMMDIDYFKQYNDYCGHQEGDRILQRLASLIQLSLRINDIPCRYGGEEFAVILPNTSLDRAHDIAEKIRKRVAEEHFEGEKYLPNQCLTLSCGVSVMLKDDVSHNDVIARSDSALYRAKYLRKNRVESYMDIFEKFKSIGEKNRDALVSIKGLISIINVRDDYTYSHTERVVHCCELVADELQLNEEDRQTLLISAYIHDIGKVNIPREILISAHSLNSEEWELIKSHPVAGQNIISKIKGMDLIGEIVAQHHERYDGEGYPYGLKGEEILPLARILTLADSFDAMTNDRPYKKKMTIDEALCEIKACEGKQFDPQFAEPFIRAIRKSTSVDQQYFNG